MSLPVGTSGNSRGLQSYIAQCPLCFESLKDAAILSGPCGHVFDWKCISDWLQNSRTCPLCRQPLAPWQLRRLHIDWTKDDELQAEITRIEHEVVKIKTDLDDHKLMLGQITAQLDTQQREIAQKTAQLDSLMCEMEQTTAQLDSQQREIEQKTAQLDIQQREIAQKTAQLDSQQREIEQKAAQLDLQQCGIAQNTAQLDSKQREIEQKTAQLDLQQAQPKENKKPETKVVPCTGLRVRNKNANTTKDKKNARDTKNEANRNAGLNPMTKTKNTEKDAAARKKSDNESRAAMATGDAPIAYRTRRQLRH